MPEIDHNAMLRYRTWNRIRRFSGLGLSCLCLSLLLLFWSLNKYHSYWAEKEVAGHYEKHPVILSWTKWMNESLTKELTKYDGLYECEFKCTFTDDRNLHKYAKALIFYDKDIKLSDLPPMDRSKKHIYYNMDCPDNTEKPFYTLPMDFFHWTLTYRQDSTFWLPYDEMKDIDAKTKEEDKWTMDQVEEHLKRKKTAVLQFESNCGTVSQREDYTEHLKKHIDVTVIGKCGQEKANCGLGSDCQKDLIVLSQHVLNGQLPEGSFIPADDYLGPEDLAKYMKQLIENPEEYLKYFTWTKYFKKTKSVPKHTCKICEALVKKQKFPKIDDVHSWWSRDGRCEPQNFAVRVGVPQPPPPLVKPLRPFYADGDYERY
ncbi:hypothetical protein L596_030005 [Steinernema carpocapsae]|uniref:Fucosyltransferase n=1 Tax=Steinernema carpocapsae TaxID=34508 RepID=A0A4U5LRF8_STECR|nr:hypothetical protein L596_030005 [Steinernema carpocapsae]